MSLQLFLEIIQSHHISAILDSILKESAGKIVELILVKVHSILSHASLDDLSEVPLLQVAILVDVIDVEEELNLGVIIHHRELSHGLYELALSDVAAPVLVKDVEDALDKELILARNNLLKLVQTDLILVSSNCLIKHCLESLSGVHADVGAPGGRHDEAHQVIHTDLGAGDVGGQHPYQLGPHATSGKYFVEKLRSDEVVLAHKICDRLNQIDEIQPVLGLLCFLADIGLKRKSIIQDKQFTIDSVSRDKLGSRLRYSSIIIFQNIVSQVLVQQLGPEHF